MINKIKKYLKFIKLVANQSIKINRTIDAEYLKKRGLKIGENCNIQEQCIIDPSHYWHIEIGNDVTLAPRVHILAHDASTKIHLGYTKIGNVVIEDKVFVGASSIILPGVRIGENSIIGSGSIVTKDIPRNSVVAGNPARVICSVEEYIKKHRENITEDILFDESYTLRANISDTMKKEMKNKIEDKIGYVI